MQESSSSSLYSRRLLAGYCSLRLKQKTWFVDSLISLQFISTLQFLQRAEKHMLDWIIKFGICHSVFFLKKVILKIFVKLRSWLVWFSLLRKLFHPKYIILQICSGSFFSRSVYYCISAQEAVTTVMCDSIYARETISAEQFVILYICLVNFQPKFVTMSAPSIKVKKVSWNFYEFFCILIG